MKISTLLAGSVRTTFFSALTMAVVGCGQAKVEEAKEVAKEAAADAKQAAASAKESAAEAAEAAGDAAKQATDAVSEGFSAAAAKAAQALEGVEGGEKFLSGLKEMFSSAEETLSGIKDKASAEAAEVKLDELNAQADQMVDSAAKLPKEAMTAVGGVVEAGIEQLRQIVDKLLSNPEIQEVIKPKIDELMDKLKKMIG